MTQVHFRTSYVTSHNMIQFPFALTRTTCSNTSVHCCTDQRGITAMHNLQQSMHSLNKSSQSGVCLLKMLNLSRGSNQYPLSVGQWSTCAVERQKSLTSDCLVAFSFV